LVSPKHDNNVVLGVTVAFIGAGIASVTFSETIHPPASLALTV